MRHKWYYNMEAQERKILFGGEVLSNELGGGGGLRGVKDVLKGVKIDLDRYKKNPKGRR